MRTVCTTRAAWADYGPGKRPAAKPIQGQGRGVRPLEVSIDDVELGTDLEWDVGTITTDVDTETDHGDHTRDFMGLHQHVELFDSQDELMQDVLLFRDHITSAPRIRLPATLVSKVRVAVARTCHSTWRRPCVCEASSYAYTRVWRVRVCVALHRRPRTTRS